MKPDTAKRLAERALRLSDDLNEMAREIEANEPDEDSVRVRHAIGRLMWAVYYEILKPTFEEHPSLEPKEAGGSAPGSTLSPRRRRSGRRRLR